MSDRYKRLISYNNQMWSKDCPILFVKGALLEDTHNKQNILQFQFQNIQDDVIIAVKLNIKCYDLAGTSIDGIVSFTYMDLSLVRGETFGEQSAIYVPYSEARLFDITVSQVITAERKVIDNDLNLSQIIPSKNISALGVLSDEFKRQISKSGCQGEVVFIPVQRDNYWYCCCGALNNNSRTVCWKCSIAKKKLFELLNKEYLIEQLDIYNQEQKALELEREQIEKQ